MRLSKVELQCGSDGKEGGVANTDGIHERLNKVENLHKIMAFNTEREIILDEAHRRL